jgi:tetratricopeptide (TPR) repeat protein
MFDSGRSIQRPVIALLCLLACVGARPAFAHGELLQRIEALTRAIEQNTNDARLYLQRGELYRLHQQWTEAVADYDRAQFLEPSLAAVDLGRGKLLLESGRRSEAKSALDRYLAREPGDGEGFIIRARTLAKLGQPKAAANDFSTGIALVADPQPDHYLERSSALVAAGETDNALRGLEEGINTLGPVLTLQKAALDIEVAHRRYDAALSRLETILSKVSRKESWLAQKGDVLLAAGRAAEASRCFNEVLSAIQKLPPRIQESESMRSLKTRVNQHLAGDAGRAGVQ